jgi:hypothetical protein
MKDFLSPGLDRAAARPTNCVKNGMIFQPKFARAKSAHAEKRGAWKIKEYA